MNNLQKGSLRIVVRVDPTNKEFYRAGDVPKQVEIFFSDLKLERSFWIRTNDWRDDIKAGVYLIRINLLSGKELEKIVEILPQQNTDAIFNIPPEDTVNKYNKSKDNERGFVFEYISVNSFQKPDINTKLLNANVWRIMHRRWISVEEKKSLLYSFDEKEGFLSFNRNVNVVMQISIDLKKSIFISSAGKYCAYSVKYIENAGRSSNIGVSILLRNKVAQTLLALMSNGDVGKGKTLFNGDDAEKLLLEKVEDPIAAAVGGYFLLKTRELDKMHDWAKNLANWFEWMPDGAIIYAWQMIHLQKLNNKSLIVNYLIEATDRGIPFFSEGLRLLYEGLSMLSFEYNYRNENVERALKKVKIMTTAADFSKEYTILTGSRNLLSQINEIN